VTTLLVLIGAALAGGALLWVIDRVIEDQLIGLYLVLGLSILNLVVDLPEPNVLGLTVTPYDVVFVILVAALLARVLRGWAPMTLQLGVVLVVVVIAYSIARGTLLFGLAPAVNEARITLHLFAVIIYSSFFVATTATREVVGRLWTTYCVGLLGVAVLRWAMVFGGLPGRGDWYDPSYGGLRVIYSNETLSLAAGFLILLPRMLRGDATRREWQLGTAFGLAVLILQHRSVIAVMLFASAVMLSRHRQHLSRRVVYGMGMACVLLAGLLVTAFDSGQLADQASSADAGNTVTFEWRVSGWQVLLRDSGPSTPEDALLGKPYGSGYQRLLPSGERVDVFPHNMYLEFLLRIGVFGLLLLLTVAVAAWMRLRRGVPHIGSALLDNSTLSVLLVAFSVYMIPYNLFTEVGVLVGMAISGWARKDDPPVEAPDPVLAYAEDGGGTRRPRILDPRPSGRRGRRLW
jgi:hypothetical protein